MVEPVTAGAATLASTTITAAEAKAIAALGGTVLQVLMASAIGQYVLLACVGISTLVTVMTILMPLLEKLANATKTDVDNKILKVIKTIQNGPICRHLFPLIGKFSLYQPKK